MHIDYTSRDHKNNGLESRNALALRAIGRGTEGRPAKTEDKSRFTRAGKIIETNAK
jgi:hypothetical protein